MAKYVRVEMIELPFEELSDSPGTPAEHFRAARQWWAAGHAACAAVAQRAASASESGSASGLASGFAPGAAPGPTGDEAAIGLGVTNFRRLVDVPGDQLADVLDAWWLRAAHDDGHLRLHSPQPIVGGWELTGSFRWRALSRRLPIDVRLLAYASRWSLLEVTPRRRTRPSRGYFRIGNESLDAFVAELSSFVSFDHVCGSVCSGAGDARATRPTERDVPHPPAAAAGPDSSSLRCQCSTRASVSTTSHQLAASRGLPQTAPGLAMHAPVASQSYDSPGTGRTARIAAPS